MIRIEYDRLVAIFYSIGVLLLLKIPNDNELIGEELFNLYKVPIHTDIYMNYKVSNILIVSFVLHVIAFILFLKWLGKKESSTFRKMNKIKVVGISILILMMPFILNNILHTLNKTWYYAGKTGVEAIEYKKDDSQCRMEKNGEDIERKCIVTLKNYRNHSQALKVVLYEDSKSYPIPNPIYLQKHETKQVEFQIPVVYSSGIEKDEVPNIKIHSLHEDDTK
ncbi:MULTISPECIES: ABC transporter permease [Bacillus cereus group]|uniref:ABC transporter permease n=1 Tax=Bacillus cereus group TaxID=86661 RepID=UPI001F55C984|nr:MULTISPECIES: ABC transporter permease [Bacillus cereus group]MDW3039175.1 ABC transporter permease [Bacillus pacificus]